MGEFLVLKVEEFTEKAACGADLAGFVRSIAAFEAYEVNFLVIFGSCFLLISLFCDLVIL